MRRLKLLVPFIFAATWGSSLPTTDPSLLAAEPYRPEIWNGKLSNEKLLDIFNRHSIEIDALARHELKDSYTSAFSRKAHNPYEKTLWAIKRTKTLTVLGETPNAMAHRVGINEKALSPLIQILLQANDQKRFQNNANCYAYSVNFVDKNKEDGNPGDRTLPSPIDWEKLSYTKDFNLFVRKVIEGATSDGLIFTGSEAPSRKGFYRIAFYARPIAPHIRENTKQYQNNEYHFARQNRDGTWSHKYGAANVLNTDYSGRTITDPKEADMGAYRFIGFFMAPSGGIKVGIRQRFIWPPPYLKEENQNREHAEIIVTAPNIKR